MFFGETRFDVDEDCVEFYTGFTNEDMGCERARSWCDPEYWFRHGASLV